VSGFTNSADRRISVLNNFPLYDAAGVVEARRDVSKPTDHDPSRRTESTVRLGLILFTVSQYRRSDDPSWRSTGKQLQ
jgi:hypothetical protein